MHKLVVLYSKPADPDHFRDYYVTNHLPLVMNMPGLLACRYSFDVAATKGEAPYFAVFDMWAPVWRLLTPEASLKVRKGNYERIFDEGRRRVRAWERTQQ